jgi:hypothetical protein
MQSHPIEGVKITRLHGLSPLAMRAIAVAYEHHMNIDLSGYPQVKMPARAEPDEPHRRHLRPLRRYDRAPLVPEAPVHAVRGAALHDDQASPSASTPRVAQGVPSRRSGSIPGHAGAPVHGASFALSVHP